jgi:hypothetical protein
VTLNQPQNYRETHDRNPDVGGKQTDEASSVGFGRRGGIFLSGAFDCVLFTLYPMCEKPGIDVRRNFYRFEFGLVRLRINGLVVLSRIFRHETVLPLSFFRILVPQEFNNNNGNFDYADFFSLANRFFQEILWYTASGDNLFFLNL